MVIPTKLQVDIVIVNCLLLFHTELHRKTVDKYLPAV